MRTYIKIGVIVLWLHTLQATELLLPGMLKYAKSLPEYPSYQRENKQSHKGWQDFVRRVMYKLGLNKNYFVSAHDFNQLLQDIVQQRALQYAGGRLIEKIVPKSGTVCVIWGQLHGAFHSLLRDLKELQRMGYVDEDLNITHKNTYFVFNGDVIGQSPYSLQTYVVVLYLMKNNPNQVIYIKGTNEDKDKWIDSPFNDQLILHMDAPAKGQKGFDSLLSDFFNSLPLALYLIAPDQREKKAKQLVRISYASPDDIELQEQEFPYFFDMYTEPVVSLLRKVKKEDDVVSHVAAYVYAQDHKKEFVVTQGLLLQSKDKAWTGWTITSSPTAEFRQQYQFFNDAFVTLHTTADLANWKFTLYYQDVRTMHGFQKDPSWYVLSGQPAYDALQAKIAELENRLHAIKQYNRRMLKECTPHESHSVLQLMHNATLQKLFFFNNHVLCNHVLSPLYAIKA